MDAEDSHGLRSHRLAWGAKARSYAALAGLAASAWCPAAHAGLTIFHPERASDRAADASHFDALANSEHIAAWTEWWYFNFHDPNVNVNGWDGFISFYTTGDLGTNGAGAHNVEIIVSIWNSNNGSLKFATGIPLHTGSPGGVQDISGYSSSTTVCDVSIDVSSTGTCTAKFDSNNDKYTVHVENSTGTLQIDLTYTRITKGFLPWLEGFPDSDWRNLFWAVPMPYANVTGTIKLPLQVVPKTISGTGYHDHNWGHWGQTDAVWDWGECPVPSDNATIIFGKVDGGAFGTVGIVVALDEDGLIAWDETDWRNTMNVTYKGGWSDFSPSNYPNVDHIYGAAAGKIIEITSSIDHYLTGSQLGYIAEIMASYSGKIYKSTDHSEVLLTVSPGTSKGFLEYKDSDGEPDTTAPGAPTGLTATMFNCQVIDLAWIAPGGPTTGYNIFRSTVDGGPYLYVGTASGETSYRDYGVDGTTYYYVVTAYDAVPNEGAASAQASATTDTGCPEICLWPRDDFFWHGPHVPFDTFTADLSTYTGGIVVGNVGPDPATSVTVKGYYATPSTGAGAGSPSLTYIGSQYVPSIAPYGQEPTGPYFFTPSAGGNDFGEPYWMVLATAESPTDPFVTGAPWDDNNVAVLNYWETTAQAGDPTELHFWMENSDVDSAGMVLEIDRSSCPAGWTTETTPSADMPVSMVPGQRDAAVLTIVPTGSTGGSVHVAQSQYNLDGEFVRIAGGLTLGLTATMLGDTNGDNTVDLTDYVDFQACLSGPSGGDLFVPPSQRCLAVFDFDVDNDVDVQDFAGFQEAFTG